MDSVKFVRAMYAAGANRFFDALGYHPYPYAGPVYVHTMRDRNAQSKDPDDTLGRYRPDGTAKPASAVLEVSVQQGSAVAPQFNSGPR
jgi:hypothetical protein